MKKIPSIRLLISALLLGTVPGTSADSISVNFAISTNDNNSVDPGEFATQFASVDGSNWNHVELRSSGPGTLQFAIDGTTLLDDTGANAATLNASFGVGGGYSNFANASDNPARGLTGEAGMMQSYLNFGGAVAGETITINGLGPEFTTFGYDVQLYFDIGALTRTYGLTVDDGVTSATFWTAETPADSDSDENGLMEWVQATGTTSGAATPDANHAYYPSLSGSSITISGVSTGGRAVLNGLQIIAIPNPDQPFLNDPSVSNVTTTGADASVTLDNSDATDVTLYWDTVDQGTGTWANSTSLGAQVIGPVSGPITGLSADTVYFYRFLATNSTPDPDLEDWSSAATSFATPLTGKSVTDLSSSLFAQSEIDLQWTDNFNAETGFSIRRSESPGGPYTEIATVAADTGFYTDNDPLLAQGTTYHYVVVAFNGNGDSDLSNETNTMNGPTPAPGPQTNVISINHTLDIGDNGRTQTPLAVTDIAGLVPDDNWNNITLLSGQNPSPHANNASITAGSLRDGDGNVVTGASYTVTSTDSWGETLAPFETIFGNGDQKLFGETAIFNGTDNAAMVIDGLTATYTSGGFRVIIYTMSNGQDRTAQWSLTPEGQSEITYDSASEIPLPPPASATTGKFRLSTDTLSPGNYIFFDVPAGIDGFTLTVNSTNGPRAPINGMQIVANDNPILVDPTASSITTTGAQADATLQQASSDVTIYWDTVDQGVRGTWSNSNPLGAQVAGPVSGAITGLTGDTIVFYRLFAANTVPGLEAWSAEGTWLATALTGKSVTDLAASLFAPDVIDLIWTDNFNTETAFSIRWSDTPGGPYTEIDTVPAGTEQYTDNFPTSGTNYYVVVAVNGAGDSDPSNEASVANDATFASWITGFGLDLADQDPLDDPDGDKLNNLIESFLGTDPSVATAGLSNPSTNGTITTFTHPQADPPLSDVTGSYEWSLDLNTWYAGDGADGPGGGPTVDIPLVTPVGDTATVTATASEPLSELFIRARATN